MMIAPHDTPTAMPTFTTIVGPLLLVPAAVELVDVFEGDESEIVELLLEPEIEDDEDDDESNELEVAEDSVVVDESVAIELKVGVDVDVELSSEEEVEADPPPTILERKSTSSNAPLLG
jgi:hypothetical protein